MKHRYSGYNDRNGTKIYEGDYLKWIREPEYYKGTAKKGQLKAAGAWFIAGQAVRLNNPDYQWWCKDLRAGRERDNFSKVPSGLNFPAMLRYIEIATEAEVSDAKAGKDIEIHTIK